MSIIKWAAVAVTGLMGLMNLGVVPDSTFSTGVRILCVALAVAAVVTVVGLARDLGWGVAAGVALGVTNVIAAVASVVVDAEGWSSEGWVIGVIVGALGALLSAAAHASPRKVRTLA